MRQTLCFQKSFQPIFYNAFPRYKKRRARGQAKKHNNENKKPTYKPHGASLRVRNFLLGRRLYRGNIFLQNLLQFTASLTRKANKLGLTLEKRKGAKQRFFIMFHEHLGFVL